MGCRFHVWVGAISTQTFAGKGGPVGPFFVFGEAEQEVRDDLTALLEPVVSAMGYELICVERMDSGQGQLLRLYIDAESGIGLEDCARVSHQVSGVLDVENPIAGEYVLEVSSPGDDRPLVKPEHFERAIGERIRVRMAVPINGRKNFVGVLKALADGQIELDVDGQVWSLAIAEIDRARLAP